MSFPSSTIPVSVSAAGSAVVASSVAAAAGPLAIESLAFQLSTAASAVGHATSTRLHLCNDAHWPGLNNVDPWAHVAGFTEAVTTVVDPSVRNLPLVSVEALDDIHHRTMASASLVTGCSTIVLSSRLSKTISAISLSFESIFCLKDLKILLKSGSRGTYRLSSPMPRI